MEKERERKRERKRGKEREKERQYMRKVRWWTDKCSMAAWAAKESEIHFG